MSSAPNVQVTRVETGDHHLLRRRKGLKLVIVSCLRLVRKGGHRDHRRRISSVSHRLGGLTGRLGMPIVTLSRLSHNIRRERSGHPMLDSVHRSKSVRRSTSVITFLCHSSCCRHRNNRRPRQSRRRGGIMRIVVRGGQDKTQKAIGLLFGGRFGGFSSVDCVPRVD